MENKGKANILIFYFVMTVSTHVWSMYGDLLPLNMAPYNACKIELGEGEVCSGVAIDSKYVRTAAHCLRNKNKENIKVTCPGFSPQTPVDIFIHDDYRKTNDRRQVDVGLLKFNSPVVQSWTRSSWETTEIDSLLETSPLCAVWTYGYSQINFHDVGHYHGVRIKEFEIEDNLINLKGNAQVWIVDSDSGAGLFCVDRKMEWVNIGTTYGHNFKDSHIVRNDGVQKFFRKHVELNRSSVGQTSLVDLSILAPMPPKIEIGKIYGIKAFSLLELDGVLRGIGDMLNVSILVEEVSSGQVKGKIRFGTQDLIRYYCDGFILCKNQYMGQPILISVERLIVK